MSRTMALLLCIIGALWDWSCAQVCNQSVTREDREKAFKALQAACAPAHVCFSATNACY
jgi:hypothetical protein